MIGRTISMTVLASLALAGISGAALAQQPTQAQTNAIKQSCRSDFQAQCSGVPTGGQAALSCLQSHMGQLSPGCQSAVGALAGGGASSGAPAASAQPMKPPATQAPQQGAPREGAQALRAACGQDFRAYCRGVPLGGGRAMECLKENGPRLSPSCRGALGQMSAR